MKKSIKCLIVDDEPVAREILEQHIAQVEWLELVASCKNAMDAFKLINTKPVDLIFLDINMPEISGLSFARSINKNIKVIFTTAYREYAVDGFDLQAVDYLLKPISFNRFMQGINKYRDEQTQVVIPTNDDLIAEKNDHIFVRSDRKMIKINFPDILYIESLSDYIKIHLKGKTVVTRETISNLESKLPHGEFIRIHRSYIVSLSKIQSYTNEIVEVEGHEIPISRTYRTEVIMRLSNSN